MKITIKICLLFSIIFLISCEKQEEKTLPPQFKWEAFQRFWNKRATDFVGLDGIQQVESGYYLGYGHDVSLYINTKESIVTGVKVILSRQNNLGGQQFLRLVEQIMDVGVFRWSGAEVATMRRFFGRMGVAKKEFSYKTSHFIRQFEDDIWSFELIFIPPTKEIWTNIPINTDLLDES